MSIFKPTYLYIKQHSITGKLYFGKTCRLDVEKYKGSGSHWKNHYTYHGTDKIETIWFCLFYDKEECNKFALTFSEQEKIVESKQWLNQIVETGINYHNVDRTGYKHSDETKVKMSNSHKGFKHTLESRIRISQVQKGVNKSKESVLARSNTMKGKHWKCSDIAKLNFSIGQTGKIKSTKTKRIMSESAKLGWIKRRKDIVF